MNLVKNINNISFIKNVAMLSSGSIIAQSLVLLASPILTRLYKPDEFGVLAAFLTFGYIFTTISTGKYELGVILPKDDLEARRLVKLSITLSVYTSAFLFVIFVFSYSFIGEILKMGIYDWILLLVPAFILLNAVFDSLKYYSLRGKFFNQIAKSTFLKALGIVLFQLLFGLFDLGVLGLIMGLLFSLLIGNQEFFKIFIRNNIDNKGLDFSLKNYNSEITKYANFPKFSMPSALLNSVSLQLPVLFFSFFFSASITGFFSLTHRVINLPMVLLGNSVGDTFIQRANEIKENKKKLSEIMWLLYKNLLFIGIIPTAILFFFGENLFVFVFGEAWRMSGTFASILSFWVFFVFICSPISNIMLINEKQKQVLVFQNIVFISRLLLFVFAVTLKITAIQTMVYFSSLGSLLFFGMAVCILLKAGIPLFKILTFTIAVILLGLAPFYFISIWL